MRIAPHLLRIFSACVLLLVWLSCAAAVEDEDALQLQDVVISLPEEDIFSHQPRLFENLDGLVFWQQSRLDRPLVIAAASKTNRLIVYDALTGERLKMQKSGCHPFSKPTGVAISRTGPGGHRLIVVEEEAHRAQMLSLPDLQCLQTFGEDVLMQPHGVDIVNTEFGERIFITDHTVPPTFSKDIPSAKRVCMWELGRRGNMLYYVGTFSPLKGKGQLLQAEYILADSALHQVLIPDQHVRNLKWYTLKGEFTGQQSHQLHGVPRGTTLVSDTALAVCVQNLASWKNQFLFFDRVPGAGSVEDPLLREQENDSFASELPHLLVAFSGRFTYLTHAIASGTVSFTDAPPHPWLQWAKEQHSRAWGSHLDEKPGGDQIIRGLETLVAQLDNQCRVRMEPKLYFFASHADRTVSRFDGSPLMEIMKRRRRENRRPGSI